MLFRAQNDAVKQETKLVSPSSIGHDDVKDEKSIHSAGAYYADTSSATFDAHEGDEALQLVGAERTAEFSEEFNARLRRRLVSPILDASILSTILTVMAGLRYPANLRSCLFYSVLVSDLRDAVAWFAS